MSDKSMSKIDNKKIFGIVYILSVVAFFFGGLLFSRTLKNTKNLAKSKDDELTEIINLLQKNYYTDLTDEEIKDAYLNGLLNELCDPFSYLLAPKAKSSLGYGLSISKDYLISNLDTNSDAFKAGIRLNDEVIGINNKSFSLYNTNELLSEISFNESKETIFNLKRGNVTFDVKLFPKKIEKIDNVTTNLFGNIGYIKINEFTENSSKDFLNKLHELENTNIEGLVIDLRNNPGGLVDEAVKMLREFLTGNDCFLQMHNVKNSKQDIYYRPTNQVKKSYDIKVLVNEYSASSAEVFALAMNRIMNYDIVGVKTFGKGIYQTPFTLSSNDTKTLMITTGYWYGYNKESIHDKGIDPTILIENDPSYYCYMVNNNTYTVDMVSDDIKNIEVMLEYLGYSTRTDGYFDNNLKDILYTNYSTETINETLSNKVYSQFTTKYYSEYIDTVLNATLALF